MSIYNDIMNMPSAEASKLLDSVEPVSERELTERYDSFLNECYSPVEICGYKYDAAYALNAVDMTAYRCGFADYTGNDEDFTEIEGIYYETAALEAAYEAWLDAEPEE
jgi:hypothetical protein